MRKFAPLNAGTVTTTRGSAVSARLDEPFNVRRDLTGKEVNVPKTMR